MVHRIDGGRAHAFDRLVLTVSWSLLKLINALVAANELLSAVIVAFILSHTYLNCSLYC